MRRLFAIAMALCLLVPAVFATSIGANTGISMETEQFKPLIWLCDNRVVSDDYVQPGRNSSGGQALIERINNYAFEGEQIKWRVLVMDKNGIEKIKDVFITLGPKQGAGNDIEANCKLDKVLAENERINETCNARILQEKLEYAKANVMAYYTCTLTVETPDSMYGEYWVTVEVEDLDGESSTFDENEHWFFNPIISLTLDGNLNFGKVRPGTSAYSTTLLVGNGADAGSGVLLDMFISGTDFYDSSTSGAKCPDSNVLRLTNFRYYATNGAYSTKTIEAGYPRTPDNEGYLSIPYGNSWSPAMYYKAEILPAQPVTVTPGFKYYLGNILAPGSKMPITFRLDLPEPCNGDFDTGSIYFWGEAI